MIAFHSTVIRNGRTVVALAALAVAAGCGGGCSSARTQRNVSPLIAFQSDRNGPSDIYVMNSDGSHVKRLTVSKRGGLEASDPAWSPDGRSILFVRNGVACGQARCAGHLWVMDPDGHRQRELPDKLKRFPVFPSWAPDGRKIGFTSFRNGHIYSMNPDGSDVRKGEIGLYARWSPDARRLAFEATRAGGLAQIYVFDETTGLKRLTRGPAENGQPAWSPDGRRIAFFSARDGHAEVYVMNADGSDQRRLTHNSAGNGDPAWSPDGKKIVFTSHRDGNFELYVMNADGSDQTRLTNNAAVDNVPAWQPRPWHR